MDVNFKIAIALILCFFSGELKPALAQESSTALAQIQARLTRSEKIQVIDREGRRFDGYYYGVSDNSLHVLVRGVPRVFAESAIRQVDRVYADSLLNGTLIGLAGGVAVGALMSRTGYCSALCIGVSAGVVGGIGAGVGAIVDRAIKSHQVIFS